MAGKGFKKLPSVPAIGVHAQLDGHVSPRLWVPQGRDFLSLRSVSLDLAQRMAHRRYSANNRGGGGGGVSEPKANTTQEKRANCSTAQVKATL